MEYRRLGSSTLKVSPVGLGTWAIGADFWGAIDDNESISAIQAGIDAGINFIDTAPAYGAGHSEEVVGKAIRGRRSQVIIATKLGIIRTADDFIKNLRPESVRKEIDDSLGRLGVDTIDLWQVHWPDPNTPLEDTLGELSRIKESGKFRYLGVSNFDTALMERARRVMEVVSLQPHYSLLERTIEAEILPYCISHDIGVVGYGTLAAGLLTGKFKEIPTFEKG
ncbi:MAG TPA: aldo/keto reductase, partial [Spirochaetia bacterium]|nr:aldo/keto reductase [Spirochaetia bacterium]